MKILLAEDDQNICVIAKLTLEHLGGHTVEIANDGQTALNRALNEEFDVILLDEMMPIMNGLKVSQEFKAKGNKSTPIIFLSAKSQPNDITEFKKYSIGHIAKPFDPSDLCKLVKDLVNEHKKFQAAA